MKILLKIIAAPVVAVLAVFVAFFVWLLHLTAWVFALAGAVVGLMGLAVLILNSVKNGIILLVIAFLIGPYGLPMLAAWLVSQLKRVQYAIQDRVYG